MPLDKMDKWRCSLNQYRYIQVDMCNEEQSAIMKLSKQLKCSIIKSSVQE